MDAKDYLKRAEPQGVFVVGSSSGHADDDGDESRGDGDEQTLVVDITREALLDGAVVAECEGQKQHRV